MKKSKNIILLTITIIAISLFGINLYHNYIQQEIYEKNSDHLLATYEQVNRTFMLFSQRNWNVLSDWNGNLQYISDSDNVETVWKDFASRKKSWQYSDFYMFNESCDFITADNRQGTADSIQNVFRKMYASGLPTLSDYTASSGKQKVVFAIPLSKPFTLNGTTYTGVAVSYAVSTVESLISNNVYGDKSSCYITNKSGDIILSLEPQSDFLSDKENVLSYLKENASFSENSFNNIKQGISTATKGCAKLQCNKDEYYLVWQPVGLNDWNILGIVETNAVNSGDEQILHFTIIMIVTLAVCLLLLLLRLFLLNAKMRLQHQQTLHRLLMSQKETTDQLFYGMTRIVDRYAVIDLARNQYEYHEYSSPQPLYPKTGSYTDMVHDASRQYFVLSETENLKLEHLLNKKYLQSVLQKKDDILKIEYSGRTNNEYKIMSIVAVKWDEHNIPQRVMMIAQDLGKRRELENIANTDSMTGLFNERCFSTILHRNEKNKHPFVLYYLDLDHFKPVNDTYGHDMGDKLLKEVAGRLLECTRSKDYVFRIGGDEFALIIHANMDELLCEQTKQRILHSLLRPYKIDGKTLHIGASCGYAIYPNDSDDCGKIRILADQRMYAEKEKNHQRQK